MKAGSMARCVLVGCLWFFGSWGVIAAISEIPKAHDARGMVLYRLDQNLSAGQLVRDADGIRWAATAVVVKAYRGLVLPLSAIVVGLLVLYRFPLRRFSAPVWRVAKWTLFHVPVPNSKATHWSQVRWDHLALLFALFVLAVAALERQTQTLSAEIYLAMLWGPLVPMCPLFCLIGLCGRVRVTQFNLALILWGVGIGLHTHFGM